MSYLQEKHASVVKIINAVIDLVMRRSGVRFPKAAPKISLLYKEKRAVVG